MIRKPLTPEAPDARPLGIKFPISLSVLADLPDKTTIGLFIYDIVTKTDAAGNVTEKQNFEWYYNLETQLVQDSGFVRSTQMDVPIGPPRYERRK